MNRRKDSIGVGIGLSSIITIFTIVSLTIFATLSYLQANYAMNKTLRYQLMVNEYQMAENALNQKIFDIDTLLLEGIAIDDIVKSLSLEKDGDNVKINIIINQNTTLIAILRIENGVEIISKYKINHTSQEYGQKGFDF